MESLQNKKHRLRSVKNIGQITKAMELVAATKMRKSQEAALASRPYAFVALELLAHLSRIEREGVSSPLWEERPIERTAVVLVASDKGLTGAFNSSVFRMFEKHVGRMSRERCFIAVGNKAISYLLRRGEAVRQAFTKFGDFTTVREVTPLAEYIMEGYRERRWDAVLFFYTNFSSALSQTVVMREVLPVSFEKIQETAREIIPVTGRFAELLGEQSFFPPAVGAPRSREYLIEPSREATLASLIPHLVTMQIYHIILEANASEHASRRLAMKNASDNASELSRELTITYNKARQAGITRELMEIIASREALL